LTDDPHGTLKQVVHASLLATLGPKLYDAELTPSELETMVRDALTQAMASHDTPLTSVDRTRLTQEISDDILGYGPIEPFLRDPGTVRGDGQRSLRHLDRA
jgi:pilus assembly protein CpaF